MPGLRQFGAAHWEKFLLVAFPLALCIAYPLWVIDWIDLDVWFYYGYFRHFFDFWQTFSYDELHKYYGTRVSYIALGRFFYALLNPDMARYAFHALFLYPAVILSFLYVARAHVSRGAAFLAAVMLATDVYFIRDIGSDYVNNGVLLYQLLALACLVKVVKRDGGRRYLVLAGFFAASMVFTHLLALVYTPLLLFYYWYFASRKPEAPGPFKLLGLAVLYGGAGMLAALTIWEAAFYAWTRDTMFFMKPQVQMLLTDHASGWTTPFRELKVSGYWVVMHWGAVCGSAMALAWACIKRQARRPGILFWIAAAVLFYGLLAVFKPDGLLLLFTSQGIYATPLFPLAYLALMALLFRDDSLDIRIALLVSLVFVASLALRISVGGVVFLLPAWVVVVAIGTISFLAFTWGGVGRRWIAPTAAALVGVATLAIPYPQYGDNSYVYLIHEYVAAHAGRRLPKFVWSEAKNDVTTNGRFISIESSFTERAHWQRSIRFPDCFQPDGGRIERGDLLAVLSTEPVSDTDLAQFQECTGGFRKVGTKEFEGVGGKYYVQLLEIPADADMVVWHGRGKTLPGLIGRIDGNDRLASEGEEKEGFLSYGPYAQLEPGRYRMLLSYSTDAEGNLWDTTSIQDNKMVILSKGSLPNTHGQPQRLEIELDFQQPGKNVEMRTYFSGKGQMQVRALSIVHLGGAH